MIALAIIAVPDGFQGVLTRDGSTQQWPVTDVFPSEDDVALAIALGIHAAIWGRTQWGTGAWGPR